MEPKGVEPSTSALRTNERRLADPVFTERNAIAAEPLPISLPLDADLPQLADALRDLLDADQRRRLAVELLRE